VQLAVLLHLRLELVGRELCVRRVDQAQGVDDGEPLLERHERREPLDLLAHLVGHDPCDQHVAQLARLPKYVELPDVEEVDDPRYVARSVTPSPFVIPVSR
jgi:hypothetical protein